jgi:hypothetical protein
MRTDKLVMTVQRIQKSLGNLRNTIPKSYIAGQRGRNFTIQGDSVVFSSASSAQVTMPYAYSAATNYAPMAVLRGTAKSPAVASITANNATQFTIYLTGTYTGNCYWTAVGFG